MLFSFSVNFIKLAIGQMLLKRRLRLKNVFIWKATAPRPVRPVPSSAHSQNFIHLSRLL